ncbi:Intramembrane protease RasP/YluC, implicated in cell division based on FtsL cleavage [hydrothermal vent metagenome]|uniref:Intramembrane protease RasP/YluC, implicated in cell division based on FtsL cleavage n=1 Tax=hydrothermal vent metagenome TaxID=652676 RepID=A0A3B0SUE2_9ZZZZ
MDFGGLSDLFSMIYGYILPFLFVLTIVVFFHELGHFLVARWCGVAVDSFSVGFGREMFGYTDRLGTRWKLCWIPLGGYVKFHGDENAASMRAEAPDGATELTEADRKGNFHEKPLASRAAIVAAGPIANFILAIIIFAVMFTTVGRPTLSPIVDEVAAGSAAAEAGFVAGDVVVSIDETAINSFTDLQRIVSRSADRTLSVVVERDGGQVMLSATPRLQEITSAFGNKMRVGVLGIRRTASPDAVKIVKTDPVTSIGLGASETWNVVTTTLSYLGRVITGSESADQLGGPIRIAQISGQAATMGLLTLINLTAVLSVSIGLINLFPIPMLDGGHLVYYGIEALRGKPLSAASQDIGFRIGMGLVLMLMLFATWNDLVHLQVL